MGRTPPRARRRLALAAVLSLLSFLVALPGAAGAGKPSHAPGSQATPGVSATGNVKPGGGRGNGHGNGGGNQGGGRGNGNAGGGDGGGDQVPSATSTDTSGGGRQAAGGGGSGYSAQPGNGNGRGNRGGRTSSGSTSSGGGSAASGGGSATSGGGSTSSGGSGSSGGGPSSGGDAPATAAGAGSSPSPSPSPSTSTGSSSEPRSTSRRRTERSRRAAADRRRAARASRPATRARGAASSPARVAADTAALVVAATSGTPAGDTPGRDRGGRRQDESTSRHQTPVVERTFRRIVEVIPGFIKAVIAALAVALLVASTAWFLLARNARFLRRQREKLVGEIGVLQGALLPSVPPELSRLEASVAYRPAEGLAAGGDFYDAFPLERGKVGIVVGDVAGHGKDALMHTALLRYTMRAYLEAGLEPRAALQVAGRVLDRGFDTLATVVLAVYDAERYVLRYATAGHPPPVFLGEADHVPVTRASSPPIGAMLPTGLRQTTVSLPAGSAVCFFTDGLIEARRDGGLIGRLGLVDIIRELGPHAQAAEVLDAVAREADHVGDDMAACMFRVSDAPEGDSAPARIEELELSADEPVAPLLGQFLTACGLAPQSVERRVADAERVLASARTAMVRVAFDRIGPPSVSIEPSNVESLVAAQVVRAAV